MVINYCLNFKDFHKISLKLTRFSNEFIKNSKLFTKKFHSFSFKFNIEIFLKFKYVENETITFLLKIFIQVKFNQLLS